jgi:CRP-like cAMP-binding protein
MVYFACFSGTVDVLREFHGDPILLGTVGVGQFIGEMGVVENRPRSAMSIATLNSGQLARSC